MEFHEQNIKVGFYTKEQDHCRNAEYVLKELSNGMVKNNCTHIKGNGKKYTLDEIAKAIEILSFCSSEVVCNREVY